jgi:hypothetical protein
MQAIRGCLRTVRRIGIIHQIPIYVMFEDETRGIKPGTQNYKLAFYIKLVIAACQKGIIPVIKYLTAHDMTPNSPAIFIPLLAEPIVTQHLRVKVVCLVGRVVHMRLRAFKEEEAVVINQLGATVKMEKGGDVPSTFVVDELFDVISVSFTVPKAPRLEITDIASLEIESGRIKFVGLCEIGHAHAEMT